MPNPNPSPHSDPERRGGGPEGDLFAREGTFIERVLVGLLGQSPGFEAVL